MIKSFLDIIDQAPKKKIIIAPPPRQGKQLAKVLSDLEEEGFEIISESNNSKEEAVNSALQKMKNKEVDILVQGDIQLDHFWEILTHQGAVNNESNYVSILESKKQKKLFFISDTYINERPELSQKINNIERVLNFTNKLGLERPKVAALSAIESVNPAIFSTVEGAALSKAGDRGQLAAEIEGPLDIDTALSSQAAKRKGVKSSVPDDVDIMITPDVESGYSISQFMNLMGKMPVIGVLLGTPFPVVIHPSFIPFTHKKTEICAAAIHAAAPRGES